MSVIEKGSKVTLNFELSLEDGSVIDSNFDQAPVEFEIGDGNLLPGFEETLVGLKAGAEQTVTIARENAFGASNPQNVQNFKRSEFGADYELEVGLMISFQDKANTELPGVIKSFDDQWVEVDFNHPLADKAIIFKAKIAEVV